MRRRKRVLWFDRFKKHCAVSPRPLPTRGIPCTADGLRRAVVQNTYLVLWNPGADFSSGKNLCGFLGWNWQAYSKIYMGRGRAYSRKEEQNWRLYATWLQNLLKSYRNQGVLYRWKSTHTGEQNRIEHLEIDPHLYSQLASDMQRQLNRERFCDKWGQNNWMSV